MSRVKIIGAGSVGNHHAQAFRSLDWDVAICDIDPEALERTRRDTYPERYGKWDEAIELASPGDLAGRAFDVVVIGTPPDSHIQLALAALEPPTPRLLLIEKPLCPPDLSGVTELASSADAAGCRVLVGFNHTLTRNTVLAEAWLNDNDIGEILTIRSMTREHWGGIFAAHPWLDGPGDTYLGFTSRGGGAIGEHSHAINIWQHFARRVGAGQITEVSATLDMVERDGARYDQLAQLSVRSESGLVGIIVADVITTPARKWLRIQGSEGHLEWEVGATPEHDALRTRLAGSDEIETLVPRTRPDDFIPEARHVAELLEGVATDSPIALELGLDTMRVVAAAIRSSQERRAIVIDRGAEALA